MLKKTLSFILALSLVCAYIGAYAADAPSPGGVSWTLDESGTLTVSGGDMEDYIYMNRFDSVPWGERRGFMGV